jgi:hypothetical protein
MSKPSVLLPAAVCRLCLAVIAFGGSSLRAHNSDVSSATVRVAEDRTTLRVEVEMSAEAAMALYGIPMGTQGIPPNRDDILPPLRQVAPEVYRLAMGGVALELRECAVEFREEDGIAFLLNFALPVDWPDAPMLEFDARYLEHLGEIHRAAITLVNAQGGVGPGRMLTFDKHSGVLPLPRG